IEVVIEGRIDRGSSIRTKERIAIGRRTDDGLGGDIAGGATPVLDDEWLTEPLRERLTHQAYEDVRSAARGISNDAAHWPPRIGLRPCDARHSRQRRGAGGQCRKFRRGSFILNLPLWRVYVFASPGRRTVNTEPLPGSLVTVTSPLIMRA